MHFYLEPFVAVAFVVGVVIFFALRTNRALHISGGGIKAETKPDPPVKDETPQIEHDDEKLAQHD